MVSCDSHYQIYITLTCNDCNVTMKTANGNSPLNVTGLDPGNYILLISQCIVIKFHYNHTMLNIVMHPNLSI